MSDLEQNSTNELVNRRNRVDMWRENGIDPFGSRFDGAVPSAELKANFKDECEDVQPAVVAGRVLTSRDMGKVVFVTIQDPSGTIQLFGQKNALGEEQFKLFRKVDIGDIIGVTGKLFRTKKGEITVREFEFKMLSKSLKPMPEKWNGLKDIEIRYRNRYLDLISNEESREIFRQRSAIIREIRRFLEDQGYMEVETPMMHPIAGGAAARPFTTHYNALDQKMYMRIATELYLKQLLVGGFEKVFELNRNFRNEGVSKQHNPEFTALEVYQAFGDCQTMMNLIEGMIRHCAQTVRGTLHIKHNDEKTLDFESPWRRVEYSTLLKEKAGDDWFELSKEEMIKKAQELGAHADDSMDEVQIGQEVYDLIEPTLIQPTFVTRLPRELVPLAKRCTDDEALVDVYELVIDGKEISPGYTELNDPIDQRLRLEEQLKRTLGTEEEESGKIDEQFLDALEHGMPPAGGLGLGVDRLCMLLTGAPTIRDIILFPQLKNKDQ
ncbi:MAG: lysine--tRNA ligase [Lentisphaeraceae bacterium]|nr:lysine--tRNA ligase [Lentisphaeraceae bacterium]